MKKRFWMVLAATLPCAAQAQAVVTERTLSLDAAREATAAALERCRKDGDQVTVTVLNRAGRTKVVMHDDSVGPHTLENSFKKAYTTITFRGEPLGEFGQRVAKNPPPHAQLRLGGDKDAVCAQAGIDRIAKALGS